MVLTHADMPVLYLSHGAPSLADDPLWAGELANWSTHLPKPKSILVVSAHWEEAPVTLAATTTRPLLYDFWGFPTKYYRVRYPAPGAPELAADVMKLLRSPETPVCQAPGRGLDHGAYVPLMEMYPTSDIPVLQVSMPTLDPVELVNFGGRLAPLRQQGVLIVGSGFATHNLDETNMRSAPDIAPPSWSAEFDQWLAETVAAEDFDRLVDFAVKAPAVHLAHPRTEHFAPLFVALGAALPAGLSARSVVEGFWHGLAKRSVQFG